MKPWRSRDVVPRILGTVWWWGGQVSWHSGLTQMKHQDPVEYQFWWAPQSNWRVCRKKKRSLLRPLVMERRFLVRSARLRVTKTHSTWVQLANCGARSWGNEIRNTKRDCTTEMVGICGVSSGFAELGLVMRNEGRVWVIIPGLCGLFIRKDSGKRHVLRSEHGYRFVRGCVCVLRQMWGIPTWRSWMYLCDVMF